MKKIIIFVGMISIAVTPCYSANKEQKFDTSIAAGLNLSSGNSEKLALNGTVTSELKNNDTHDLRMELNINYGESENGSESSMIKDTDNGKGLVAYKYKYDNSLYLYSEDSVFYDDMADIDYRIIIGGGVGYFVINSDKVKLGLETGLAYVQEKMSDESSDGNFSGRLALRHDQDLSETSKIWLSAEFIPSFEDSNKYLANGEAGIEAAINTSLSLRLVAQDRYNSDVNADTDRNDLSLISALVYKL